MSTNFYWIKDRCECCGRGSQEIHVGSNHTFRAYDSDNSPMGYPITSWQEWKRTLSDEGAYVRNERGGEMTLEQFVKFVESRSPADRRREFDGVTDDFGVKHWLDADGFTFSDANFG